jgi:phage FluMu protein Com
MDAVQTDQVVTVLFCNHCGKAVKVYASEKIKSGCPYCKGIMQDKNIPGWNELDIVERENILLDWRQQAKDSSQLDERLFQRRNKSKLIRLRLKSFVIYASALYVAVILIYFFKNNGVILGGIPSAIIYLIAFLMARIMAKAVR